LGSSKGIIFFLRCAYKPIGGIPEWLESIPVHVEVTGMVVALGDTTAWRGALFSELTPVKKTGSGVQKALDF